MINLIDVHCLGLSMPEHLFSHKGSTTSCTGQLKGGFLLFCLQNDMGLAMGICIGIPDTGLEIGRRRQKDDGKLEQGI